MKLSIVTPSFTQGQFIERTILSVLEQDRTPDEYVIFDGGSTDETVSLLKKYDSRLCWTSEKDAGQTDAVNKGIKATSGDVIGWLNSDDIYYPGTFKAVLECFEQHPEVDVVYGKANHIDENDNILEPYYSEEWDYERLKDVCFLCQPAVFFRRRLVEKIGLLDETLQYCMDYEYWLRAGATTAFYYLPQILAGSRMYGDNKTLGDRIKVHKEICTMFRKRLGKVPSKWIYNYAHSIVEEHGYNRNVPKEDAIFCFLLSARSSLYFLQYNHKITSEDMRTMFEWVSGSVSEFLRQRKRS